MIECKILRGKLEATLAKGLPQTAAYMDRCGADASHLVIFDRSTKTWEEKIFRRSEEFNGTPVEVWGIPRTPARERARCEGVSTATRRHTVASPREPRHSSHATRCLP